MALSGVERASGEEKTARMHALDWALSKTPDPQKVVRNWWCTVFLWRADQVEAYLGEMNPDISLNSRSTAELVSRSFSRDDENWRLPRRRLPGRPKFLDRTGSRLWLWLKHARRKRANTCSDFLRKLIFERSSPFRACASTRACPL